MLVVNLWGAPSSGKSTTAAGLFFLLKINKWRVEQVHEFAKEMVWEKNESVFGNQNYIFSEQERRQRRLEAHDVEAAITDSPLPLPVFYQPPGYMKNFEALVMEQFHRYNNINYMLKRTGSFEVIGRRHNETEAEHIDKEMRIFMERIGVVYTEIEASPQAPQIIFEDLMKRRAPPMAMPLA